MSATNRSNAKSMDKNNLLVGANRLELHHLVRVFTTTVVHSVNN